MGVGSVERLPSGKYRARIRFAGRRVTIGVYDTQEEAERMARASIDVRDKEYASTLTLRGRADKLFDALETGGEVSRNTACGYRDVWRVHGANAPIARIPVRKLKASDVYEWLTSLDVSTATKRNALTSLRALLRDALRRGEITSDPTRGVRLPREKRTEIPTRYLSPNEQARLLTAAGKDAPIIEFAMLTGLRAGELVTLRWDDVHLDDETPHAWIRYGAAPDKPTKGGRPRKIPLSPRIVELLRARVRAGKLVWPRAREGYRDPLHVLRWERWSAIRDAAGLTCRWHDLRHTCATTLLSVERWPIEAVQAFLGHAHRSTTERYAKITDSIFDGLTHADPRSPSGPQKHAPPIRIERTTFGLGNGRISERLRAHTRLVGRAWDTLAAIEAGDVAAAERAWAELIPDGPLRWARIVELCRTLVDSPLSAQSSPLSASPPV